VDEELKGLLGSVRKKTWAFVVMLFAASLFVQSHVKHDLEQETEARKLLQYISLLEKQTSIYLNEIKKLKKQKCTLKKRCEEKIRYVK